MPTAFPSLEFVAKKTATNQSTTKLRYSAALGGSVVDTFVEDLHVVKEIMDGFLSQDHVSKGLKQITEIGITGWEKWWQIELAIFLDEYPELIEWDMEIAFDTKNKATTLYVDFGLTMKGWDNKYVFLELKQNNDYKKCIDLMFKDAEKYEDLKSKSVDGIKSRSKFVVGMCQTESWGNIQEYFDSCMVHYEFELKDNEYLFLQDKGKKWGVVVF